MQYINVRQLLSNYKAILDKLPVTVTKYGKPLFTIVSPAEVETPEPGEKNSKKIIEIEEGMLVPDKDPEYAETVLCEAPNMKCKDWAVKRVHFESPEYEDMTLNFCERHLKELKKLGADILSEEDL